MRDSAGVTELVERMKALRPALIVLEATGGFEQVVAAALAAAGLCGGVNPRQIRDFAPRARPAGQDRSHRR
jgi:transposase